MTLDEVIQEEIPNAKIAVLSGPSHAEEVSIAIPTVLVLASKYDAVLNSDSSVKLGNVFYYHIFNGKLFLLISNNTVSSSMFTNVQGDLASSLYQALLSAFSIFELYFKTNKELKETVRQRKFIDLGFVISRASQ